MSEEVKKISFGFSKLAKPKTTIISSNKSVKSDEGVQYIDCVEDKSIKVKNELPKEPEFLVIPLPKENVSNNKRSELLQKILNSTESDINEDQRDPLPCSDVSNSTENVKLESLDELAAKEIIEDLKKVNDTEDDKKDFTVPLNTEALLSGKEATLDDYDSIPIDKFGMAMLRGMGWAPGKGIGKTEQVILTKQPVLRPKGLGLGADKVLKADEKPTTSNEQLQLIKGSFVRIIAGINKDLFGEVIGFDDETGRLIVKMALGNNVLTFNEFMVKVISKDDFINNSKVINVKKYEEYKMKENSKGVTAKESSGKQENDDGDRLHHATKIRSSKRKSNESSSEERENPKRKYKIENRSRTASPQQNRTTTFSKNDATFRKSNYKPSPDRYSSKYRYSHEESKKKREVSVGSSSSSERKDSDKYYKKNRHKESSKSKFYALSSEESSRIRKHVSHKESKMKSRSSSSSERSENYSEKEKKSKSRNRKYSTSSCSSEEDRKKKYVSRSDYKKQSKKCKEKKKSRRRSRSYSKERKTTKTHKKHKKNKYYD